MKESRRFTLEKSERLCAAKQIDSLFSKGTSFFSYPFKVIWIKADLEQDSPAKVLFAVSKKKLKLSSQRNNIKRIMRESFRLNKFDLYDPLNARNEQILLGLIYVGKQKISFHEMNNKIKEIINRLAKIDRD